MRPARTMFVGFALFGVASGAAAQVRVGTWNLTEYTGQVARSAAFQGSIFGEYQGRTFAPEVLIVQEISSDAATSTFRAMLNSAPGSPGDYLSAPFVNGPNTDSACFFRSTKVSLLATDVAVSGSATVSTRHVMRYRFRLTGHTSEGASFFLYSAHLKASDTAADAARRGEEAALIRDNLDALPPGTRSIVGGDFNLYTHNEAAWTNFLAPGNGRLYDPINRSGVWSNNASFAVVHTQSPAGGSGGMDDRFDFLMVSDAISQGQGLAYLGNRNIPYGGVWNDPNHSHRAWGNDGFSFNTAMRVSSNTMVGPTIAQAIVDHYAGTSSPPHLPVYFDLQIPARASISAITLDFGTVAQGSVAQLPIIVTNIADVAFWSKNGTGAGIDALTYAFAAGPGFAAPGGSFDEAANPGVPAGIDHLITMDTSLVGVRAGTLMIATDDPENPTILVNLAGTIITPFDYDVNNDGTIDIEDLYAWHALPTDVDGNGSVNNADRAALLYELRRLEMPDVTSGRR